MFSTDFKVLLVAALAVGACIALLAIALRVMGLSPSAILTSREWRVVGKCVAIVALTVVLLLRMINSELAASMFIYGRF